MSSLPKLVCPMTSSTRWTRSARTTRRQLVTSAMRPSSGWMPTSWLRWKSSLRSRRRWKGFATQLSPSCTLTLVALQEACQEVCQTWEAWVEHLVLALLQELAVLDLPLRRWTNLHHLTGFADSSGVEQRSVDTKICETKTPKHLCWHFNWCKNLTPFFSSFYIWQNPSISTFQK